MISIAHPDFRERLFASAKERGLLGPERSLADSLRGVYPLGLEEVLSLEGERVFIRPSKPSDERLIQEHFYGLDKADVQRRFLHEKASFLRAEVDDFSQVDYVKNLTMLAVTGEPGYERVIAVGAYFLEPARNLAEVAYSVSKDWQGRGLGGILQRKLAQAARENGISGLVAYTTPENQAMVRLFAKLPYKVKTQFGGDMLTLSVRFDQPALGTAPPGQAPS